MPIDSSSNPFGGGGDPDDLANAGKGVGIPDKSLEPLDDDDDLADAGKGSFGGAEDSEPVDPADTEKGLPGADDEVDPLSSEGAADDDVLGSKLDDVDDDVFDTKSPIGADDDDDIFDTKGDLDDDVDDDVDVDAKDFDIDI